VKPSDIRDQSFEALRGDLEGLRREAYQAWIGAGPGTTAEVAARSGMDLLTFRPRTTELVQCGLVELVGRRKHEGIYQAVADEASFRRLRPGGEVRQELFAGI